jgi:hypothetical protein
MHPIATLRLIFSLTREFKMELDDKKRSKDGVVACIRDEGHELRLIFDDVESENDINPISWNFRLFYTWHTYNKENLLECNLTDDQYRDIGLALMARLRAIYLTKKNKCS